MAAINDGNAELPSCTSRWTEDNLKQLQISPLKSRVYTAKEIISLSLNEEADKRVYKIDDHFYRYMPYGFVALDFDDFYSVKYETVYSLLYDANGHQMPSFKLESLPEYTDQHWCNMFRVYGEQFCKHLIYMAWQRERGVSISACMFQQLFQHFTAMFGLHSIGLPSLHQEQVRIKNTDVRSTPNLSFCNPPSYEKDSLKTYAICTVKKLHSEEKLESPESPPTKQRRRGEEVVQGVVSHLCPDLIGQHGGQLFVHFQNRSENQLGLLGFIVQDTNVTFTHFSCEDEDYDLMIKGKAAFPEGSNPVIKFSRPYNYLKSEDRLHIIQPLLKLGFVQSIL